MKTKKYLITGAEYGEYPEYKFLRNLEEYAKKKGATLVVLPYAKIPSHYLKFTPPLSPLLASYAVEKDTLLCKNLELRRYNVTAQQIKPLTGLTRLVSSHKSAIIGSPKQHMLPSANSNDGGLPKVLISTGTCTKANYTQTRTGRIAKQDHTLGAVYVEVRGSKFHFRNIRASSTGQGFTDLGYRQDGENSRNVNAEAIILGDLHTGYTNEKAFKLGLDLIKKHNPKHILLHDLFDGRSVNHHEQNNYINKAKDYLNQDLHAELKLCGKQLSRIRAVAKDSNIVVVKSNHDEFLDRYLNAGKYSVDPRQLRISCLCTTAMLDGKDPLKAGIESAYGHCSDALFLGRDEDYKILGYQLGAHGDKGANGSRGSYMQAVSHTGKSISGHTHTPLIFGDVFIVGTSTDLKMGYNVGPSSWMNTHAVLWQDRKVQLINSIDGEYQFSK